MKPLILAVLLAVGQASYPIPRQAPNSRAEDSRKPHKSTDGGQNPTFSGRPSTEADNDSAGRRDTSSNEHQGKQGGDTVNITNPIPMPAPWGWREWITWASNPVLAVIGVIGICIGIGSLCAISRQVRHIATSERAWLVANIVKVEILNIPSPSPVGAIVRVVNKGKTPGFISEAGGAIEALMTGKSLPDTPIEYLDRNIGRWKGRGMPLVPEDSRGRWVSGEINGANVVWAGASVLWIHGYIKYRDAFGNKIRETRFCFRWIPPSNAAGLGEQFLLDGPSGYNEAT